MVEDTITDGERIATILRAEIESRETAGLDSLAVRDEEDSTRIVRDDQPVAEFDPSDAGLALHWLADNGRLEDVNDPGLTVRKPAAGSVVIIETGAAVKRAVDLLADQ